MKLTTIDELTDEIIGKRGIPERDIFEYDLRIDIVGTMIWYEMPGLNET